MRDDNHGSFYVLYSGENLNGRDAGHQYHGDAASHYE